MKKYFSLLLIIASLHLYAEEGMYPLSDIHKINLKAKGFKISAQDIYNPNGVSLVDACVNVGGCSGSFISKEGLIITNHHCAFSAVQQASSLEHDYVKNGFLARTKAEEIPAKGLTVRIIDSYRDVSKEVLSGITDSTTPEERSRIIDKNSKKIIADVEEHQQGNRASVAEMFAGKTYVLFIYKTLRDVRLVYVPPRSIGEFGGEDDNWVWPRHTGDFSFVRAYVGKDGAPADYSPENIPFTPKKFFRVNPNGVEENDRVFILGYPGRTFRHETSYYLQYENDFRLRSIQQRYAWMIEQMELLGKNDPAVALKLTSRIKSLANVEKNYRGKLKGLKNLPIIQNKIAEEEELQKFIDAETKRKAEYGGVLAGIKNVYAEMRADAPRNFILSQILGSSTLLSQANMILKFTEERQKPDPERQTAYMERNIPLLKQNTALALHNAYVPLDKIFFREIILDALHLPKNQLIMATLGIVSGADTLAAVQHFTDSIFAGTHLQDEQFIYRAMEMSPEEIKKLNDPLIEFARSLQPELSANNALSQKRSGELNRLSAKLVDVKMEWKNTAFIPDANGTLRLTFGHIRGYSPADAVYYSPISSLRGVLEKSSDQDEYNTPKKVRELFAKKVFGRYKNKKLNDLPVDILYDMDTTGGNSGSPILNANGELIGVNFDRAFEATVNDYAWNEQYSRSIGVDIRYVLWNVEKVAEADFLLKEIGVQ